MKTTSYSLYKFQYLRFRLKKLFLVAIFSYFLLSCHSSKDTRLLVACASSTQYALKEISDQFKKETGIEVNLIFGSSGKLAQQIISGAPFHVFLSADTLYPYRIHQGGYAAAEVRKYAYGRLALWTNIDDMNPDVEKLKSEKYRKIAVANPKLAPYGKAAFEVLYNTGWDPEIEVKLIYGENIMQTSQYILSKSCQVGFTALSVVKSPRMTKIGKWALIDKNLHSPITHSMVVIKTENEKMASDARKFHEFILSEKGQEILEKYGYDAISER
jgi:molybdate transport system substrate-binding protein